MPTAGSETLGTVLEALFEGVCTDFTVWCDGPVPCLVYVEGMHAAGEGYPVPGGSVQRFRIENMGIRTVTANTAGGPSVVRFAVTGKTARED